MSESVRLDQSSKEAIEEAIRWAPSADNSQPWIYHWRGDDLDLSIDSTRAGGVSDARFLLSDLALGAATEAAVLQASTLGLTASLHWLPQAETHPEWAATLSFEQATEPQAINRRLAGALTTRHTSRVQRLLGTIDFETWAALEQSIEPAMGATLHRLNGAARQAGLKALALAEAMRFQDQRYHAELMSSIRFDKGLREPVAEGIAPGSLGLQAAEWPFFKLVRHWRLVGGLKHLGLARVLARRSAVIPTARAPGLGLLTLSGRDRVAILQGGRALLRVWLAATVEGLVFQPFAAPTVFSMGFAPSPGVAAKCRESLERAVSDLLSGQDQDQVWLMIFRLGYPPESGEPARYSLRR